MWNDNIKGKIEFWLGLIAETKAGRYEVTQVTEHIQLLVWDLLMEMLYNQEISQYSPREQQVLNLMLSQPYYLFSRDDFLDAFCDDWGIPDRTIDVHMGMIRKKLPDSVDIITVSWAGYYLKMWNLDIDSINNKIEIREGFYFIPQIQSFFQEWNILHPLTRKESEIFITLTGSPDCTFSKSYLWEITGSNATSVSWVIAGQIKKIRIKLWESRDRLEAVHWQWYKWNSKKRKTSV